MLGRKHIEYELLYKHIFNEIVVTKEDIKEMSLYKYIGFFGNKTEREVGIFSNSPKKYVYGGKKHISKPLTPFLSKILE